MLHKFNRKRILTCSACKVSPSWSPLSVEYVADVPVVDCHCCHGKTSSRLRRSSTKPWWSGRLTKRYRNSISISSSARHRPSLYVL